MDEHVEKLEESNRSKYGPKDRDIIAQAYELGQVFGDFWCIFNMKKYMDRYLRPSSSKGKNLTDLLKVRDYLDRAIQRHPDYKQETELKDGEAQH